MSKQLILGNPSEKQKRFLLSRRKFVAFGGARGGGKSWAVRSKAVLLCGRYPGIVVMIIRQSYPELRANHIEPLRKLLGNQYARYNDARKEYRFANGSTILFRYCASESDMDRYQGTEADVIFIDEATQFDEQVFRMFVACCRGANDYPKRVYLTCNPGGKGHGWVKRLFIDRRFKDDENPDDYEFIQSMVTDNTVLMQMQPEYIQQLEALPPKLRDAWLYGKWDLFEGQFFEEFKDDPDHYQDRQYTHVINPFTPPEHWRRFRSFDFGYSKPFSVGWWAQDTDGTLYRIAELYGCTDQPNEGIKWDIDRVFAEIARVESEHPYLKGHNIEGVADPAIWEASHGKSIAEQAAEHGIYFAKGDNKRIAGWMQMHYRLSFDGNGRPALYVFSNCKAFIRTIPLLIYSTTHTEDLDTTQEDHVADESRYLCMMNPIPPRTTVTEKAPESDPLNLWQDRKLASKIQYL